MKIPAAAVSFDCTTLIHKIIFTKSFVATFSGSLVHNPGVSFLMKNKESRSSEKLDLSSEDLLLLGLGRSTWREA